MPKPSQGICTTEGSKRIELSYLLKQKTISKNKRSFGVLSWTNRGESSGNIAYEICFTDSEKWIRLFYTRTDYNGNKKDLDYKVYFASVKSNLGIGECYYFICPQTFRRCRILYMAYGSEIFKSRQAYRHRIYYDLQTVSKKYYSIQRYFNLEKQVDNMYESKMRTHYRGRETRTYKRFRFLNERLEYFDSLRLNSFYNILKRMKVGF